ncbi:amidohydrolase family protein [Pseudomonas sp. C32]|uniref:amidohydrolase family protein n=1 Tax=Pseudomonas sp. C32 TaxID=1529208 RepID=UPI00262ADED3|nr:amidohydrolase family protein [Pseudomonas sp. C32]MDN4546362.1 amidohydrolase family protein [Pseudomonas sp. C32]
MNQDIPPQEINWFFDHAETISEKSIDRIAALGGGLAVQHRMAYRGEYFVERYAPPADQAHAGERREGLRLYRRHPLASYNPWVSLSRSMPGKTVAGLHLYPQRNLLDQETALRMWTENAAWFSNDEGKRGRIQAGQFADLIVPSSDYFTVLEDAISVLTSDLTMVGGRVAYGANNFASLDDKHRD